MTITQRLRILPLLVLVAVLSLAVRIGDFASGVRQSGVAFAQQEVQVEAPPLPKPSEGAAPATALAEEDKGTAETKDGEGGVGDSPDQAQPPAPANAAAQAEGKGEEGVAVPEVPAAAEGEKPEWKDASEAEFDYSEVREGLYKDLVKRREELEAREKDMALREAMLEAAERELDQKVREMVAIRNDIQGLLQKQSEEELARVDSLVRIYEGMKAKDAARIFDTLDMDVLISVMARMSERKSGPILAEMSPERARSVTILLAKQKQIPDIPPQ